MGKRALSTMKALKDLRELRERRTYEALLRDHSAANRARAHVADLENRIDAERADAERSEDEALAAAIGHSMSPSDLSRLQAMAAGGHKKAALLGENLAQATAMQEEARATLDKSREAYRADLKAFRKIEAASDEAHRKAIRRQQAVDELLSEEDGSGGVTGT